VAIDQGKRPLLASPNFGKREADNLCVRKYLTEQEVTFHIQVDV
jgi:hypothetical protein